MHVLTVAQREEVPAVACVQNRVSYQQLGSRLGQLCSPSLLGREEKWCYGYQDVVEHRSIHQLTIAHQFIGEVHMQIASTIFRRGNMTCSINPKGAEIPTKAGMGRCRSPPCSCWTWLSFFIMTSIKAHITTGTITSRQLTSKNSNGSGERPTWEIAFLWHNSRPIGFL